MSTDVIYYPNDGSYHLPERKIYAEVKGIYPRVCRKYHVSTDIPSALTIAENVLPFLREAGVAHKVVKNQWLLVRQTLGRQAGKFITLYMKSGVDQRNAVIAEIDAMLTRLRREQGINPCPWIPRYRPLGHVFMEQPLDDNMFIYGGFTANTFASKKK